MRLSLLFFILAFFPIYAKVTEISIKELAGVTTPHYPVTFGHPFIKGHVQSSIIARINGLDVPAQMDIKNRYDDGSVRYGIISLIIPLLTANSEQTIELSDGSPMQGNDEWNKDSLLFHDFDARLEFKFYRDSGLSAIDSLTSISARQIVQNASSLETWLSGGLCTEFLLNDTNLNPSENINVQYQVRCYPGWNGIRVSVVAENVWHCNRGAAYYDVDLFLGNASPINAFSRDSVRHWRDSRWRRVFWLGNKPSRSQIKFNVTYLISTGYLPPYDYTKGIEENKIAGRYASFLNGTADGNDILENGVIFRNLIECAGRDDRKIFPSWTTDYLYSMDWRNEEVMLCAGEQAASFPVHGRNKENGRILQLRDFPGKFPWLCDHGWDVGYAFFDCPYGDMRHPYTVSWGYPPSFPFVPYIITGDYYYMEEQLYWAAYSLWYEGRNSNGIVCGRNRENAMHLREILDSWVTLPDNHSDKAYFKDCIDRTIDSALCHIARVDMNNQFGLYLVENRGGMYENNYFILDVADQLARLGFAGASQWRDFMLRLPVGVCVNHPDFNKWDAVNYFSHYIDFQCSTSCQKGYRIPDNWADAYRIMTTQTDSYVAVEMGRDNKMETQWIGYLIYALAIAKRAGMPKSDEAYQFVYDYLDTVGGFAGPRGWSNPECAYFDSRDWLTLADPCTWSLSAAVDGKQYPQPPAQDFDICAYPNPFNPVIVFSAKNAKRPVQINIYDIHGKRVHAITDALNRNKSIWDAHGFPSGTYLIKVKTGNQEYTLRITLLK